MSGNFLLIITTDSSGLLTTITKGKANKGAYTDGWRYHEIVTLLNWMILWAQLSQ